MSNASRTQEEVRTGLVALAGEELALQALGEFDELCQRFDLGDFRPSELSGARFSEAVFRICQMVCFGTYLPLGKPLPKIDQLIKDFEQVPVSKASDTFRLHIPRTLRLIYDLRNKRDVAHLGNGVSPNFPDASLVLTCASWVMAEIIRISHDCGIQEAQVVVDNLIERRTSMLWSEGNVIRVLDPNHSYRDKVLLILHHLQPEWINAQKLFDWVEYSNPSAFRKNILKRLHDEAMVHFEDDRVRILPPGNNYVEKLVRQNSP